MRLLNLLFALCVFCLSAFAGPSLAIFTHKASGQEWDPDSIRSGITGSEEAVIYLSEHLARLGYVITVFGNPPSDSTYQSPKANPRYLPLQAFSKNDSYDIAISWRMPALGAELRSCAKKVYLWPHDRSIPLLLSEKQVNAFDDVLWVSKWQREDWCAKNPSLSRFNHIFGNGVNPEQFKKIHKRKNPYSCIYGSNYGQGLFVLLDIWPKIREQFPKATLDIYYGWQHFGALTPEKEAKMRKQIADLREQGVRDHGKVSHEELNKAYAEASFWTYPCVGTETFSISALRAQISGAIPVALLGSGLLETVGSGYTCTKVEDYYDTLVRAFKEAEQISMQTREQTKDFVLQNHTWAHVALRWHTLFSSL